MGNRVDETIPIIDLSALQGNYDEIAEKDFKTVAQAFGTAMSSVGFVYIKNHGVEMNKVSEILRIRQIWDWEHFHILF